MSPGSNMVNIGTWSDSYGLVVNSRNPYVVPPKKKFKSRTRDKTYVMTSILEEPFLMVRKNSQNDQSLDGNDKYEGYAKDLAQLMAREIGVSFEIRPVQDGKYGSPNGNIKGAKYLLVKQSFFNPTFHA